MITYMVYRCYTQRDYCNNNVSVSVRSAKWLSAYLTTAFRNGFVSSAGYLTLIRTPIKAVSRFTTMLLGIGSWNRAWIFADISKKTLWFFPIA